MVSFIKSKGKIGLISIIGLVLFGLLAYGVTKVRADNSFVPLVPGDVSGFAWMGQNITPNGSSPQGGGGWLSLNCKPVHCVDSGGGASNWGVQMDITETPSKGQFSGHAWSSNYGWLSFQDSEVDSCWRDNPFTVSEQVAKAQINLGQNSAAIRGWAKFIAGDAEADGWDGCVSFDTAFNQTYLDLTTGVINGWAWGGDVVGWVSFANPECPFCNTSVVLTTAPSVTFWAEDYDILRGTGTVLRWDANDTTNNYVAVCEEYGNTSNYSHWRSDLIIQTSNNVGDISVSNGNLPTGGHPINNINAASTTYSLTCKDQYGAVLPTQYVTITTYREVRGCTNPLAINYDPSATVDDGSCVFPDDICTDPSANNQGDPLPCTYDTGLCTDPAANNVGQPLPCTYGGGSTNLSLNVAPNIFYIGDTNFDVNLSWTANNPVTSCVGRFIIEDTDPQWDPLEGWTFGVNLPEPNPTVYTWTDQNDAFNDLLIGQTTPMTYTFRLTCQDSNNNPISDTATVNLIEPSVSSEPPVVELFILQPNEPPELSLNKEQISPINGANPVRLKWSALNVQSCVAISNMYVGNANDGANAEWDGQSLPDDDAFNNTQDITNMVTMSPYLKNTIFTITCTPENSALYGPTRTASVCVGLRDVDFPQCTIVGSGNIPSYEEI